MSEFENLTTIELLHQTIIHLTQLGHTNISHSERWENDGVIELGTDQSIHSLSTLKVGDKEIAVSHGWTLSICGTEVGYTPGIDFVYQPRGGQEETISVTSWAHLTHLIREKLPLFN